MICVVRRVERETVDMTLRREDEIDVRVAVDLYVDGDSAEVAHVEDHCGYAWTGKLTDAEEAEAIAAAWERWIDHGGEA